MKVRIGHETYTTVRGIDGRLKQLLQNHFSTHWVLSIEPREIAAIYSVPHC